MPSSSQSRFISATVLPTAIKRRDPSSVKNFNGGFPSDTIFCLRWVKQGRRVYETLPDEPGQKITDDEMRTLRLKRHEFHGDWNYTIQPHSAKL